MGELVTTKSKPLFRKKHELAKLVRDLKKVSARAVEVLEAGLSSQDERVRMIAAEKLLKFYADTAKEVADDDLKRLLLDIKVGGMVGQGSTADDDDTPALNFDEIHEDFRNATVVDMSNVSEIKGGEQ